MLAGLGSGQTSEKFLAEIYAARAFVSQELEGSEPQRVADTRAYLRKRLTENLTERDWTDIWLDTIAWSSGISPNVAGAGLDLLATLRESRKHIICQIGRASCRERVCQSV